MKHTQILCALVAIVCVAVLATAAMAAAPKLISYQGKATDASGNPVADGNHTVRFDLFSSATTGTSMWNEQTTVTTSAGLFTHQLGSVSPLPYYSFSGYEGLWLQLTFDGVIQTPRTQFTSVAYAFHVQSIHNSEGGNIKDGLAIYDPYTDNEIAGLMADGAGSSNLWLKGGDVDQSYHNVKLDAATNSLEFVDRSSGYDTTTYGMSSIRMVNGYDTTIYGMNRIRMADGYDSTTYGISSIRMANGDIALNAATTSLKLINTTNSDTCVLNHKSLQLGDSVLRVNDYGMSLGSKSFPSSGSLALLDLKRDYSSSISKVGLMLNIENTNLNATSLTGIDVEASFPPGTPPSYSAYAFGIESSVWTDGEKRYGVKGFAAPASMVSSSGVSYGVYGAAQRGLTAIGVYGTAEQASSHNLAGVFDGNVDVRGTLSKSGGSFKIDHPLDPERKYLQHSFVESPDMKNIYDGTVTTDGDGLAVVMLPDYFSALNRDFRYQLTVIGQFAQAIIAEEISGNQFVIQTDKPNVKVSWLVTGIRKDKWAEAHRIEVEVDKSADEIGTYIHPEEFGQPKEKGAHWVHMKEAQKERSEREAQE